MALKIITQLMEHLNKSEAESDTQRVFDAINDNLSLCQKTVPSAANHSAIYRKVSKSKKEFDALFREKTKAIDVYNQYAAWTFAAWEVLATALAIAQDITNKECWFALDTALTKLALSWQDQFPQGTDIGHDIYMTLKIG